MNHHKNYTASIFRYQSNIDKLYIEFTKDSAPGSSFLKREEDDKNLKLVTFSSLEHFLAGWQRPPNDLNEKRGRLAKDFLCKDITCKTMFNDTFKDHLRSYNDEDYWVSGVDSGAQQGEDKAGADNDAQQGEDEYIEFLKQLELLY